MNRKRSDRDLLFGCACHRTEEIDVSGYFALFFLVSLIGEPSCERTRSINGYLLDRAWLVNSNAVLGSLEPLSETGKPAGRGFFIHLSAFIVD